MNEKMRTVVLQPITIGRLWDSSATMSEDQAKAMAALASKYPMLTVLPARHIDSVSDLEQLPGRVSAYILGRIPMNLGLLHRLSALGKPIIGSSLNDRGFPQLMIKSYMYQAIEQENGLFLYPRDENAMTAILNALRGVNFLQSLRLAYYTTVEKFKPPYSVAFGIPDSDTLMRRFGLDLTLFPIEEYYDAVESIDAAAAHKTAHEWLIRYHIDDSREERMDVYARVYLAAKQVLAMRQSNGLCMHCDSIPRNRTNCCGIALPGEMNEFVPCWTYALLIDEGIPAFCKGDMAQMLTMSLLMGITGQPNLMGDMYRFGDNQNLMADNIITITHDLIPPSMSDPTQPITLRDMHGRKRGLTGVVQLTPGSTVTVAGMDRDMERLWFCHGTVQWTKDIAAERNIDSCRNSVAVQVANAEYIVRNHLGEHQILCYGDWTPALTIAGQLLGISVRNLDHQ